MRETPEKGNSMEVWWKTSKHKGGGKQHTKTHARERDMCQRPGEDCGRSYTAVLSLQSHIFFFMRKNTCLSVNVLAVAKDLQ